MPTAPTVFGVTHVLGKEDDKREMVIKDNHWKGG